VKKLWQTKVDLDAAVEAYTVAPIPTRRAAAPLTKCTAVWPTPSGLVSIGVLPRRVRPHSQGPERARVDQDHARTGRHHTAVEQALTAKLGETGAKVHAGRSRKRPGPGQPPPVPQGSPSAARRRRGAAAAAWAEFGAKWTSARSPATRTPGRDADDGRTLGRVARRGRCSRGAARCASPSTRPTPPRSLRRRLRRHAPASAREGRQSSSASPACSATPCASNRAPPLGSRRALIPVSRGPHLGTFCGSPCTPRPSSASQALRLVHHGLQHHAAEEEPRRRRAHARRAPRYSRAGSTRSS